MEACTYCMASACGTTGKPKSSERASQTQGFPILINGTLTSQDEGKRLFRMGIKKTHLASDVANSEPIHQTEHRTIELSEQTGNRSPTCLTPIFPQAHVSTIMQAIFNGLITNDKFCLSRMRYLPKKAARGGFPQERQYSSEAIEETDCPKVEVYEQTTMEHPSFYD